jgi:hypothetical protein
MKRDIDAGIGRRKVTVDIYRYIADVTLDIVGDGPFYAFLTENSKIRPDIHFAAALDHQFGALDKKQDNSRDLNQAQYANVQSPTRFILSWLNI